VSRRNSFASAQGTPALKRIAAARRVVSCALSVALLASFLLPLAPMARAAAQGAAPDAQTNASATRKTRWNSDVFVITSDDAGNTVCREATAAERLELTSPDAGAPGRVLIYEGAPLADASDKTATNVFVTETGQRLLPSAGLRIVLHGTSQLNSNVQARDAFIAAANRWESLISTQITVVLDVDYGTEFFGEPWDSPSILGATGVAETSRRFSQVRQQLLAASPVAAEATLYNALPASSVPTEISGGAGGASAVRLAVPAARALGFIPDITNPDGVGLFDGDAGIGFNSAFNFDFNPNDGITPGTTDFDAVVVHEIGHALGFSSESGIPFSSPTLLDLFRFRPGAGNASNLATVASAQRVMVTGGQQVFFSNRTNSFGNNELALSTGGPSGSTGDGEQSSHWKADEQSGQHIGIMDPTLSRGVREVITENDKLAFDAFGYRLDGVQVTPPAPPPAVPPVNDNFADAIVLSGATGTVVGDNFESTRQNGEPDPTHEIEARRGSRSVWYNWTAPASGAVTMDTIGSDYDTSLGAYTGSNFNALTPAGPNAENDDIVNGQNRVSRITFTATAGTTYRIMVNGWDSDTGTFKLNWVGPAPVQSFFQFPQPSYGFVENTSSAVITVIRTSDTSQAQSVSYATSNGTATAGSDYAATSGTLNFAAGEASKNFLVVILNDSTVEPDETFNVTLSNPTNGASLGNPTTVPVAIVNDDVPPQPQSTVQFSPATATVGEGAGTVTLTVARTGDTSGAGSVGYFTSDSSASGSLDYNGASGTLSFAAGETSKTINVTVLEDTQPEPSETFTVTLSSPSNGVTVGGNSTAVVTITDNDAVPVNSVQFSVAEKTVGEGDKKVELTVTRTGDTSQQAFVGYSTAQGGTALQTSDYVSNLGTLIFSPNETQKTITVFIVDDAYGNGNTGGIGDAATETFVVVLTNSVLTNIGATPLVTVTITNNETNDASTPVEPPSFDAQFFVREHYLDFLNREADTAGLNFWAGQTTGCGNSDLLVCRINASAAFFLSPEFQETGFYVIRARRAAFGKRSDVSSPSANSRIDYYQFIRDARQVGEGFVDLQPGSAQVLEANKHLYAVQIVTSGEFIAGFPYSMNAAQYVDGLYAKAGVTPTAAERQEAISIFESSLNPLTARTATFRKVVDSQSVRNAEFRGAFVLLQYFGYMRRDPDQAGYDFWLGKLNEHNGNYVSAEMVKAFITSSEYRERFGIVQ
jgi:hypothetical protein